MSSVNNNNVKKGESSNKEKSAAVSGQHFKYPSMTVPFLFFSFTWIFQKNVPLRRSTRLNSQGTDKEKKDTGKKEIPYVKYDGRIVYMTDFNEIAATADEILLV